MSANDHTRNATASSGYEPHGARASTGSMFALAIAAAELITVGLDLGPPLHPALSLLFVMSCPGLVLLDFVGLPDVASRLVVASGASLAFNVTVATVLLVMDSWSAAASLAVTGIATGVAAVVSTWAPRTPRSAAVPRQVRVKGHTRP